MKTISFKNKIILILSFVTCIAILAGGALFGVNTAKADATGFETVKGATIRIHNEKERLGIRYQLRMESEQYNTFMATYTDVEFGAFIIPEDYRTSKGAFTELNLFGGVVEGEPVAPIYYWGDVAEDYKTGKTQIINLSTDAMTKVEEVGDVSYNTVYAAITNVKTQNATRAFAGVGYVKYTDGETVKYIISDNGSEYSYSIAQVADNALNNPEYQLEDEQIAAIEEITAIKPAVKLSADKGESTIKTAVSALNYTMGSELDITAIAKENAPAGMIVDEQNSTLKATVPYVGYAEFDVNYVYDVENLDGKNLLEYSNLFATDALVSKSITCCSSCVISQPDIGEGSRYYPGKYIYSYCVDWTGPCVYLNKEFTDTMIAEGNTILTIVFKQGSNSPVIRLNDYDLTTFTNTQYGTSSTDADGYITTTFDLVKLAYNGHIAIRHAGNTIGQLYIYDINFSSISTTGNLANTLKSSGIATSTYNEVNYGQLFHYGTENYLYFNAWSGYGNYMILDSDFVANCFKLGLTNIKIKYYVNPFGGSGWIKIGPRKYDGATATSAYLSSRATSPWLSASYDSTNPIETTWVITPEEVASFNFDAGDQLWIGEMASGSGKTQIVITHFEFCKPA